MGYVNSVARCYVIKNMIINVALSSFCIVWGGGNDFRQLRNVVFSGHGASYGALQKMTILRG